MATSFKKKIRGFHLDLYQHVNHGKYLEFLEEARWDIYERFIDFSKLREKGLAFVVVNINISYKTQIGLSEEITIYSGLKKIGNKSAIIHHEIQSENSNKTAVEADVTFVILDFKINKAVILKDEILEMLKLFPEW